MPMVSTESGIETEFSPLAQKARAWMDFTPGGMVTEGIRLLKKAPSPMVFVLGEKVTDVIC